MSTSEVPSEVAFVPRIREDVISDALLENLYHAFDMHSVDDLRTLHHVDLPHRPGEQLDYVQVGDGGAYFIPGFTEGITSKSAFALALSEGVDRTTLASSNTTENSKVITTTLPKFGLTLPDQNRTGIDMVPDPSKGEDAVRPDAIYSQALNYLELIIQTRKEDATDPLVLITHSMGSLVLQKMFEIAKERELNIFDGAHIVMLAPAGIYPYESKSAMAGRFVLYSLSELKSHKDLHDETGEMFEAGMAILKKNKERSIRETLALSRETVDIQEMLETVATVAVVGYGKDYMYTDRQLKWAVAHGATYFTPVSFGGVDEKGKPLSSRAGATHNDEQFHPRRVAFAVRAYLDGILKPSNGEASTLNRRAVIRDAIRALQAEEPATAADILNAHLGNVATGVRNMNSLTEGARSTDSSTDASE
jgi:hypothetical protein